MHYHVGGGSLHVVEKKLTHTTKATQAILDGKNGLNVQRVDNTTVWLRIEMWFDNNMK